MKINVHKGNQHIKEIDLSSEVSDIGTNGISFFVGRSEDSHVCLDDIKVSRDVAELRFEQSVWKLHVVAEMSPVIVNGRPVSEVELKENDVIYIDPFTLYITNLEIPTSTESGENTSTVALGEGTMEMPPPAELSESLEGQDSSMDDETSEAISLGSDGESIENPEDVSGDSENDFESGDEGFQVGEDNFEEENSEAFPQENSEFQSEPDDVSFGDFAESSEMGTGMGGDNDSFAISELDDDEGTVVVENFANFVLEISGEFAPYDKYLIDKEENFIGRDEQGCQIFLDDPEASGKHAVIRRVGARCELEDLKSSNGTLLNGARVNKSPLVSGDEILIGTTLFRFLATSDLINQEQGRMMPVADSEIVEVEEIVEVDAAFDEDEFDAEFEGETEFDEEGAPAKSSGFDLKDEATRKKLIYAVVAVAVAFVLLAPDPEKKDSSKKVEKTPEEKSNLLEEAKKKEEEKKRQQLVAEGKALSPEDQEAAEAYYLNAKSLMGEGKYIEAISEFDKVILLDSNYKQTQFLVKKAKDGLAQLEELERKRQEEEERILLAKRVADLVKKATKAVDDRKFDAAQGFFGQILQLDPENYDVPQLKIEIEAWKEEQDRIAIEKAQKEAERQRKVDQLSPGKNYYLQKKWYAAILKLEEFLKIQKMDEDLIKEATEMLNESRTELSSIVSPLLGKARSLKEGQDLKGSYEVYLEILSTDPANSEALNEMDQIRETLSLRSRRVYREALISESLSLFDDAKEKFREVQQISPSDSDYYLKATEKLKNYVE